MRIAMFSPVLGDAFGQERVMRDSIIMLRKLGHEVFLFGDTIAGNVPECESVYSLEGICGIHPFTPRAEVRDLHERVFSRLTEIKPDLVHFIDQFDAHLMLKAAKNYPCILTAHTVAPTCPSSQRLIHFNQVEQLSSVCTKKSGWSCLFYHKMFGCLSAYKSDFHRVHALHHYKKKRAALQEFKKIIAISEYVKNTLIEDGFPTEKIATVCNPVSVDPVSPLENAPNPLIVCASRLVELKGIDFLIHALKEIQNEPWTLWICGDGPLRADLTNLVGSLDLTAKVVFKGRTNREETTRILQAATLVVQPNIGPEGFGLTVAEAQSLGKPVVAYDIPALNEIIENEGTGLLVKPKSISELSQKIEKLLKDPALRTQFGNAGRERIKKLYSPEAHLRATLEVYRSCTEETVVPKRNDSNILSISVE